MVEIGLMICEDGYQSRALRTESREVVFINPAKIKLLCVWIRMKILMLIRSLSAGMRSSILWSPLTRPVPRQLSFGFVLPSGEMGIQEDYDNQQPKPLTRKHSGSVKAMKYVHHKILVS